jgi:hypothetical protein
MLVNKKLFGASKWHLQQGCHSKRVSFPLSWPVCNLSCHGLVQSGSKGMIVWELRTDLGPLAVLPESPPGKQQFWHWWHGVENVLWITESAFRLAWILLNHMHCSEGNSDQMIQIGGKKLQLWTTVRLTLWSAQHSDKAVSSTHYNVLFKFAEHLNNCKKWMSCW